ncbi:MAG: hypothetical protein DRQ55_14385 [Planctomycetota bacterium]|nr:MAG: hypothetical protein DRQ55_14385 [Planctomycetota bacterium]
MATASLNRLITGLRARYHMWSGLRAYRHGRVRTASRHLDEALSHGHESFTAFLLAGKIAWRERDLGRAAECFHRAREADPARFQLEGFPDDFLATLRNQPNQLPPLRVRIQIETGVPRPARRSQRVAAPRAAGPEASYASPEEEARLRDRPAIQPGEGGEVDWDAEARGLFDD